MRVLICALLLVGTEPEAPILVRDLTDQEKLQGDWTIVSSKTNRGDTFKGRLMRITKDKLESFNASGESEGAWPFKLDPKKTPRQIDLHIDKNGKKRTLLGIYSIDGDRLQLAWSSEKDAPRPKDFTRFGGDDDVRIFVLQRKKK